MANNKFENSIKYKQKIHKLIPGGAHTYSKGDDQFPENSPAAVSHGKGSFLWDIDGNRFLDCTMGLAAISIGHAYDRILNRVKLELDKGVNFQRPSSIELEMAEKFLSLLPGHDMIKYAKNGSTVTTAAVKLARAYTGRKLVAFPGDHPFYSYDDWFIGKTNTNLGVPEEIQALSVTFKSCDLSSLENLFQEYPGQIACVITEPEKNTCYNCTCENRPEEFLKKAIELCHKNEALFILDEMQSGFRVDFPGAVTKYGLQPDMVTWGKGIANGFSFCALTGTREVMQLGSIDIIGKEKLFLISTTNGAETHSIAACLETISLFENEGVIIHNHSIGRSVIEGTQKVIQEKGLSDFIKVIPCDWMPGFIFLDKEKNISLGHKTLFLQEMIQRGILFQGLFIPCYSHSEEDVIIFIDAFSESLEVYAKALDEGFENYLIGSPIKPVFRKYN